MADENYTLPEVPVYREAIRKILNEDPVNAEEILNPLVQALLENIHFVKLLAEAKAESTALDRHTGDQTAHVTEAERSAWDGKAAGNHSHTAADVGALASDGTAAAATKLATARTIRTNLASTSAVSFNGTANITPGVTGTLPIANGGTGGTTASAAKANLGIKDPKRTARFTVGTSKAGWTADQVDYLCDGTADDVEINAAIQALPAAGGEVVILDGEYIIDAPILLNKGKTVLVGNSFTTLKANYKGGSYSGCVEITSDLNVIKGFRFFGQDYGKVGYFITLQKASENKILDNIFETRGSPSTGIYIYSLDDNVNDTCDFNTISGNIFGDTLYYGIANYNTGIRNYGNLINKNIFIGCNFYMGSLSFSLVCNNMLYGVCGININGGKGTTVCNNTILHTPRAFTAISVGPLATDFSVIGNHCMNSDMGILIAGDNGLIANNICTRNTDTFSEVPISRYKSIEVTGKNNLVVGNHIMEKNYINSGTGNTFANNKYQ